jgi:hypothetical protein
VVVVEDDEEEDEDELEDDEEEEEVEVVLEDELEVEDVVDVVEEELDEETLVEVVEELGVVVDSVVDGVWLDETVCDWVLLLFDEPEFRTKYPPTATTITTTTIAPTSALLNAVRLPRANEGKRSDVWFLWPIFSQEPRDLGAYILVTKQFTLARPGKGSTRGPLVLRRPPPSNRRVTPIRAST